MGSFTDIQYKAQFHPEFDLSQLDIALAQRGNRIPQNPRICEIGFGMGLNLIQNAFDRNNDVYGIDLIPEHARFVNEALAACGQHHPGQIICGDITDPRVCDSWPQFDVIIMHGVWTWVSEPVRSGILDFFRAKLALGGIVFVSYNVASAWGQVAGVRPILLEIYNRLSTFTDPAQRVERAFDFWASEVLKPLDQVVYDRVMKNRGLGAQYLAHEFLNEAWAPSTLSEVAQAFRSADLKFLSSARLVSQHPSLTAIDDHDLYHPIGQVVDDVFKLTHQDAIQRSSFRTDIFQKGLWLNDQRSFPGDISIVRVADAIDVKPIKTGNVTRQVGDETIDYFNTIPPEGIVLSDLADDLKKSFNYGSNDVLTFLHILRRFFVFRRYFEHSEELDQRSVDLNNWIQQNYPSLNYRHSPAVNGFVALTDFETTLYSVRELSSSAQLERLKALAGNLSITKGGKELTEEHEKFNYLAEKLESFHNSRLGYLQTLRIW